MKTSLKYIILLFLFTFCQILPQGNAIYLNLSLRFQDITKTSQYRMIGLPGDIDLPLARFMTGTPNKDWTAFYDDGEGMYTAWTSTSSGNFYYKPGQAYWVISKYPIIVDSLEANAVTLQNDSAYSIPLKPGWNMITSPFIEPVNYEYVRQLNNIPDNLYYFRDGRFYTYSLSMEPYLGYYLYNRFNLQSLKIPHPGKKIPQQKISGIDHNFISISLIKGADTLSTLILGLSENASNGIDELDQFMPPGSFCDGVIYSENLNTAKQNKLAADFRPYPVNSAGNFKLNFNGSISESKVVFDFSDNTETNYFYISRGSSYEPVYDQLTIESDFYFSSGTLNILAGTKEQIESQKALNAVPDFRLEQNYPNPFNPSTTIDFALTKSGQTKLQVFDIKGALVKTLLDRFLDSGPHEILFDAENLASGIYYYRLTNNSRILTKKMALLR